MKTPLKENNKALNLGKITWMKYKRIPPQNIVIRLFNRSISRKHRTHYQDYREFYQVITPNFTVCNIRKPNCFVRKFSPCGRYLLAFSADQSSLEIYQYQGGAVANDLLHACNLPKNTTLLQCSDTNNDPSVNDVVNKIFEKVFKLICSVPAAGNLEQLNRECSLFSSDGRHVLVASCSKDGSVFRLADTYRNFESVTPNPRFPLGDYTITIIELETGIICDQIRFRNDKIFLAHNQGLSLLGDTLVIHSVQHQTLHRYHVSHDGRLIFIQAIGCVCYPDDDAILNACIAHGCSPSHEVECGFHSQCDETTSEEIRASKASSNEDHVNSSFISSNGNPEASEASSASSLCSLVFQSFGRSRHPTAVNLMSSSSSRPIMQPFPLRNASSTTESSSTEASSQSSLLNPFTHYRAPTSHLSPSGTSTRVSTSSNQASSHSLFGNVLMNPLALQRPIQALPSSSRRFVFPNLPSSSVPNQHNRTSISSHTHMFGPKIIYSLKHRLLTFLFKVSQAQCISQNSMEPTQQFFAAFDMFLHMRIVKMQLLDEQHLLIKYGSEDVATQRTSDPGIALSYLVVYNMDTTEIIAVYENTSKELLELFERFVEYFRNPRLPCEPQHCSFISNNIHARLLHERYKKTLTTLRGGGTSEATKRILADLPVACQAYSRSPYLDLGLFSYQDKLISIIERPKSAVDHSIRFYGRESGQLKFTLETGTRMIYAPPTYRHMFTFHPYDPLAISVQKRHDEYVVGLHMRYIALGDRS